MSDLDATTPRVFLNGRYTGITDLGLTAAGVRQVAATASHLVGPKKLLDPTRLARVWVSPRKRARQTFELLFGSNSEMTIDRDKIIITEDIAEWDYGDYEGLVVSEIKAGRKKRGLDQGKEWDIWRNGCEGGESAEQVKSRLDRLISDIHDVHRPNMNGEQPADVLLVANRHINSTSRSHTVLSWLKYPLVTPLPMMLSPGAIDTLSYRNYDIDEPGFFLGMSLPSE
ncbi:phosphoglycerate mutase [Hypoxylon sp. EC38]|nr:phosphoglycerate mutase [Hypoxylon sp. EC38]